MSVVSIDRILSIEFSFSDRELIAFVTGILTIAVVLEMAGLNVGAFRSIPAVIALSVFPGYLIIELFQLSIGTRSKKLLYAIGLSMISLMIYGFSLNQTLTFLGVEAVFTEQRILIAVLLLIGGLLAANKWRNQPRTLTLTSIQYFWHPWPLALLSLPFLSVLGARIVTRFGESIPILVVLTLLAVVVLIGYFDRMPRRYFPLAVYVIALSILLHNSVLNHVLAWDAGRELRLANLVIENGIWDPSVGGRWMKNSMLRIVMLHPIYTLVSGIELLWEFKIVHPVLYAFAPVALFKSYQSVFGEREALLAILLAVSYFPFFTVTSVNTRTGGAILFLSLFTLCTVDSPISRVTQRFLAVCFLFGIIVSHYGVAFITMLAIPMAVIGGIVLFDRINLAQRRRVNILTFTFFITVLLTWYIFVVYLGAAFDDFANESFQLLSDVQQDLSQSSSGSQPVVSQEESKTTQYATRQYTSNTIKWLQDYYLLIGGLAGAAIALLGLEKLWHRITHWRNTRVQEKIISQSEYLFLAAGHLAVFGITFVGVERLNTARTLLPALVLFAPFVIWIPVIGSKRLADTVGMKQLHSVGRIIAVVIVIGFFALNVGITGSLSGEYHPNIMIDKGRVIDDGSVAEKNYFWAMHYRTVFDPPSQQFVATVPGNESAYNRLGSRKVISKMYNCTNIKRQPVTPQGSCDAEPSQPVQKMDKVYTNSGSVVYYNQSYSINQ